MKPKQLREWLFQNGQEDQWWVCIDTVTEESPLTVAEIEDYIASGDYGMVQALHVSQTELNNPPWIDVELPSAHSPGIRTPMSTNPSTPPLQSSSEGLKYANYNEVPYNHKQWFFWLMFILFTPIAIGLLIFGDVYYEKRGQLKSFGIVNRIVAGIIGLVYIRMLFNFVDTL